MAENTFLFVTCVNDDHLYEQCKRHIQFLHVPETYTIEFLAVRNSRSMTQGYNQAMLNDAKYKIYLHQDTFIISPFFLFNVLSLFQNDSSLGMFGMIGCKNIPENGVWWEGKETVGKVIEERRGAFRTLTFDQHEYHLPYVPVQAVDGLLMVTQYDLPWREDLFTGYHFYDTSQCLEFIKKGYKVGVASQLESWCIHCCGDDFDALSYEAYRKVFIQEYMPFLIKL